MPAATTAQAVGWLLLFLPGFTAMAVAAHLGWPATNRTQLHWLAYALVLSLTLEVVARWTADPLLGSWVSPDQHPFRRAGVLLGLAIAAGTAIGWLQSAPWFNRLWWRLFKQRSQPTVWTSFFRDPTHGGWARVELKDGKALVGYVDQYSIDSGLAARELILIQSGVEINTGWIPIDNAAIWLDASQIANIVLVSDPANLAPISATMSKWSTSSSTAPVTATTPKKRPWWRG
jgi:Family of unknown function (DUF6338)